MDIMSQELANKLKAARQKLGLSQAQAAQEWGLTVKTLQNWEHNISTPRGLALTAINEKLDAILAEP